MAMFYDGVRGEMIDKARTLHVLPLPILFVFDLHT